MDVTFSFFEKTMRQRYWLFLFLLLPLLPAEGQQRAQYSQYMLNQFVLNPALSGLEDFVDVKLGYRSQWAGLEGTPRTFYVAGHGALDKTDRTSSLSVRGPYGRPLGRTRTFRGQQPPPAHNGIGGIFLHDETGPSMRSTLMGTFAHHFVLNNRFKVSAGIGAGITQHTLDFDQLHLLNPNDPVVQQGKLSRIVPELSAGVLIYDPDFYLGLSVNQLLFKKLDYGTTGNSGYEWLGTLYNHYFLTAGYRIPITEEWSFLPSVMIKSVRPAPVSYDLNAKFSYLDRFWVGGSYRHRDAIVGLIGVNINYRLNLGYSYDFTLSDIRTVSRGTHEIVLGFMLRNRQRIICPRLF